MNNFIVTKSNKLIESSYKLSISEQRLVLACIAQIDSKKSLMTQDTFEVSAEEISELANISLQNAYRDLKTVANRLYERSIIIDDFDHESRLDWLKTRWISSIGYRSTEGKIVLTFAPKIIPYLSQLKNQFTQYKLINISKFTSLYSIRLYELLMQWKGAGRREIEISWLKKHFQIENEYSRIGNLKSRVIDPAVNQINEHSDLWVAYGQKKRGRKITHFIFEFGLKKEKLKKKPAKSTLISKNRKTSSKDHVLEALIYHGIAETNAKTYLRKKGEENILKALNLYKSRLNEGKVTHMGGGYLIKLIEGNAGQGSTYQMQQENVRRMTLTEYCRLPENHRRTTGKSDSELIVMMHKDGIQVERY